MKYIKILLVVSLVTNAFFIFKNIKATPKSEGHSEISGPFSITNLNSSGSNGDYIVGYKDGKYWWNIDENGRSTLSMGVGLNEKVEMWVDKNTGKVKATLFALLNTNSVLCYYIDSNADGVPDKMTEGTIEKVFYNGDFVSFVSRDNQRFVTTNGIEFPVVFLNGRWTKTNKLNTQP